MKGIKGINSPSVVYSVVIMAFCALLLFVVEDVLAAAVSGPTNNYLFSSCTNLTDNYLKCKSTFDETVVKERFDSVQEQHCCTLNEFVDCMKDVAWNYCELEKDRDMVPLLSIKYPLKQLNWDFKYFIHNCAQYDTGMFEYCNPNAQTARKLVFYGFIFGFIVIIFFATLYAYCKDLKKRNLGKMQYQAVQADEKKTVGKPKNEEIEMIESKI